MKFKVHLLTFLLWIVAFLNDSIKPIIFLFLMMTIHELAHCMMAWFFKLKVSRIDMFPFGLCAKIEKLESQSCLVQICVILAGLLIHGVIPILLLYLYKVDFISLVFYKWCLMMNFQICLFNCLPIYPLDGSRIFQALLLSVFSFYTTKKIIYLFSVIFSATFFMFIKVEASSLLVFSLLIFINLIQIKDMKLEAALHKISCDLLIFILMVYVYVYQ